MSSKLFFLLIGLTSMFSGWVAAQEPEPDKTLSPYFLVQGGASDVEQFALESTAAEVKIAGVIADVLVTQVYKNDGKRPIEAIYVFPASTRAAVYGMKMTIGERVIVANIEERQKARQQYEQARDRGQSASLLEQQRPNVFQMNVANIMPGDHLKVELRYTELLVPESGVYSFAYPTVVGPRYSNQAAADAPASEHWVANPYLREGAAAPYTFDLKVDLAAGLPIADLGSRSHQVDVRYEGKERARVTLKPEEKTGGNRDFVLNYRLAGERIATGLLLFQGKDENFFLLMAQPPKRVRPELIPPREYIFIMDVSGSMHGFPIETSKALIKNLIGRLRPEDSFNVLTFSGDNSILAEHSLPATAANIAQAIQTIDQQRGGGGTELLPALTRALGLGRSAGISRSFIIVTDGYVNIEKEAFELIRNQLGEANVFAFGIGSSVNRFLIEGLARAGMGEPFIVENPQSAEAAAERLRNYIQNPVLTDVRVEYRGFAVTEVEPPSIPDVLAERPVIVFGKWQGDPAGEIIITGKSGEGPYREVIPVASTTPLESNAALRYLWARQRIAVLDDFNRVDPNDERVKQVTNLGLSYNLLTAYTSFVAIDSAVRNQDGRPIAVKQPLPLPAGVSNLAVGGAAPAPLAAAPMRMQEVRTAAPERHAKADSKAAPPVEAAKGALTPAGAGPAAVIETLTVTGGRTPAEVRPVLEKGLAGIATCLAKDARLAGRLTFTFTIDARGRVTDLKLTHSELGYGETERCVKELIKHWGFPSAAAAGVTVTFAIKP